MSYLKIPLVLFNASLGFSVLMSSAYASSTLKYTSSVSAPTATITCTAGSCTTDSGESCTVKGMQNAVSCTVKTATETSISLTDVCDHQTYTCNDDSCTATPSCNIATGNESETEQ